MSALAGILAVTFPFFALVLCGYLAARSRLLPLEAVAGLITIGAVLARSRMQPAPARPAPAGDVAAITLLKLVAHPALVWGLGAAAVRAEVLPAPLLLAAALPSASNVSLWPSASAPTTGAWPASSCGRRRRRSSASPAWSRCWGERHYWRGMGSVMGGWFRSIESSSSLGSVVTLSFTMPPPTTVPDTWPSPLTRASQSDL